MASGCDIGLGGLRLVSLAEARETAATYRKLAGMAAILWRNGAKSG